MSNIKLWESCMDEDDSDYAYPYYKGYITKDKYFKCSLIDREIVEDYTWHIDSSGYVTTKINNKNVYMHNLLVGEILVDHINKIRTDNIRTDNRRCNLRKCTSQENNRNRSKAKNNTSGIIGVSWKQKSNKWRAYIVIDGSQKHLGEYSVKEHAIKARLKAELEWFGEYAPQKDLLKEYGMQGG